MRGLYGRTDKVRWLPFLLQRGLVERTPDEGWNRTAVGSEPCLNRTDTLGKKLLEKKA